jgi:sRNA-binding carbon storage regulator CsrA
VTKKSLPVQENDVIQVGDDITVTVAGITEDGQVRLNIDGPPELTISDKKTGQSWKNDGSVEGVIGSDVE